MGGEVGAEAVVGSPRAVVVMVEGEEGAEGGGINIQVAVEDIMGAEVFGAVAVAAQESLVVG